MRVQLPLRRPRRFVVAVVLLLAFTAASTVTAVSVSSAAGRQQVPLLRIGIPHPVNTLDVSRDVSSFPYVSSMGLETLLQITPTGRLKGLLAQSVTQPGRAEYVYHLRHNVHFWDGTEMTSADVANALNYYRDPHSQIAFYYKAVKSIVALNRYTVAITLKHPDSTFQFSLANTLGSPIFEKRFQDAHKTTMGKPGTLMMGTGPWKFDSLDPTRGAEMSAWSGYWGPKPLFKHLSFKFFTDVTSMALAFRAGALDLVPEINDARSWTAAAGANPTVVPGCEIHMFWMPTQTPPWNDIHVRRAVAYALNRAEQIQAKGTPATPVTTLILPVQLYRLEPKAKVDAMIRSLPQYPFDLAKAKAELAQSAYPNGFSADFPTVVAFFGNDPQVIAAELAKIGIKLAVHDVPFSDWIDAVVTKHNIEGVTYAACLTGDPSDYPLNYLDGSVVNAANYHPPAVDELIKQGVFYSNPDKRFAIYTKLLQHLATDVPYVPLFTKNAVMAISSKYRWPLFDSRWAVRDYVAEIQRK